MIYTLKVKNFITQKNVRFDVQKINLFTEPYNSGKSTIFKIFPLLLNTILSNKEIITKENFKRN